MVSLQLAFLLLKSCHILSYFSLIAIGRNLEAASYFVRRTHLDSLKIAAHVTLMTNESEAAATYARRYLRECQLRCDWLSAYNFFKEHEKFKVPTFPFIFCCSFFAFVFKSFVALRE